MSPHCSQTFSRNAEMADIRGASWGVRAEGTQRYQVNRHLTISHPAAYTRNCAGCLAGWGRSPLPPSLLLYQPNLQWSLETASQTDSTQSHYAVSTVRNTVHKVRQTTSHRQRYARCKTGWRDKDLDRWHLQKGPSCKMGPLLSLSLSFINMILSSLQWSVLANNSSTHSHSPIPLITLRSFLFGQ